MPRTKMRQALALLVISFAAAPIVFANPYHFEVVQDMGLITTLSAFEAYSSDAAPGINSVGAVAFSWKNNGVFGVYVSDGAIPHLIIDATQFPQPVAYDEIYANVDINDHGTVTFYVPYAAYTGTGTGSGYTEYIYRANSATHTLVAQNTGSVSFFSPKLDFANGYPSIGADDTVVYRPTLTDNTTHVFATAPGSGPVNIFNHGVIASNTQCDWLEWGQINNRGDVIIANRSSSGTSSSVRILGPGGNVLQTVSLSSSTSWIEGAAISNSDDFAYVVRSDSTAPVIHWGDLSIAMSGSSSASCSLALSDVGLFAHCTTQSGEGIYQIDTTGTMDPLMRIGDAFDGSTIQQLLFNRESVNDSGQISFYAKLGDGRMLVVRGDVVPEPAGMLRAAAALTFTIAGRRRRAPVMPAQRSCLS